MLPARSTPATCTTMKGFFTMASSHSPITPGNGFIDLAGQRFGRLLTIDRAPNVPNSLSRYARWNTVCDCGNLHTVSGKGLRRGNVRSCGCLARELASVRGKRASDRLIDLTGRIFGRLTVLGRGENTPRGQARWECLCTCGEVRQFHGISLRNGETRSCGCLGRERTAIRARTHGMTGSLEYNSWGSMIQRCTNPKNHKFPIYGGRGIMVCGRWLHSFENFLEDMGPRPSPKHSIERLDNDGPYTPKNSKWGTATDQNNNKRNSRRLTFGGETMTIAQWEKCLGFHRDVIWARLKSGWSVEKALSTPPRPKL